MDIEIDTSRVVANLLTDFVKSAARSGKTFANAVAQRAKMRLDFGYSSYAEQLAERCGKIKTLVYRDAPVSLLEHYVGTRLISEGEPYRETAIFKGLKVGFRAIITGTAGSGKSIFVKRICLELLRNNIGLVPIFIELRHLNHDDRTSILDFATSMLATQSHVFNKELLEYGLEIGKFCLALDGFDELSPPLQSRYAREIWDIVNKFPNTPIIISGRPDSFLESWDNFHVYKVLPMEQEDAIKLISKIRYDEEVKEHFISELQSGLFRKHGDFASNPLLLTMMLLTYEQCAQVPGKLTLFYDEAFTTLFNRHDATKSLYKRESYSKLPIDEFKRVFGTFCFFTYFDNKYSFSESELNDYIIRAIRTEAIPVDAEKFLQDLFLSVCLLRRDGIEVSFVHRSFQEYFCALFLLASSEIDLRGAVDHLVGQGAISTIVPMLAQMNLQRVEEEWAHCSVTELLAGIGEADVLTAPTAFIRLIATRINYRRQLVDDNIKNRPAWGVSFDVGDAREKLNFYTLFALRLIYPDMSRESRQPAFDKEDLELIVSSFGRNERDPDGKMKTVAVEVSIEPTSTADSVMRRTSLAKWCQEQVKFLRQVESSIRRDSAFRKGEITAFMQKVRAKSSKT